MNHSDALTKEQLAAEFDDDLRHDCPDCGRIMSDREYAEQRICNDCQDYNHNRQAYT